MDGAPVINRRDVYYRSAGGDSGDDDGSDDEDDDKGLIGGLLPTLGKLPLGKLLGRASSAFPFVFGPQSLSAQRMASQGAGEAGVHQSRPKAKAKAKVADVSSAGPIGFTGLFFR